MQATSYRRRHELNERQQAVKRRISLLDLCATGYHFCRGCQHVTNIADEDHGRRDCAICGSHNVRWCPPVLGFAELQSWKEKSFVP